ncbi:hypothetical protein TU79_07025 [Pseudomonas trivialis]|uniref:Uncharacterized protein n=1 Tax=Pseudomonas trivialis TaxID=200450 RepID=A0A0R2ZMA3_9PSED|nr:hypothetical protein TU79_07025 [Pseudomonas trivialis]
MVALRGCANALFYGDFDGLDMPLQPVRDDVIEAIARLFLWVLLRIDRNKIAPPSPVGKELLL